EALLDVSVYFRSRRAAKRRLAENRAVNNWPIVIDPVAVVVDARRRIERPGRSKHRNRSRREVPRKAILNRRHAAMTLVHHARATLDLAELCDVAFVW